MSFARRSLLLLAAGFHLHPEGESAGNGTAEAPTTEAPAPGAVSDVVRTLREQFAQTGKLTHDDGQQPRTATGQFQSPTAEAAAQALEAAAAPPPDGDPADPAAGDPVAGELEADPAGAGDGAGDPAEGAEGDQGDDPTLLVMLPGRRPDDEPIPFRAESLEEAETLRRTVNGYRRNEELRQERERLADRERQVEAFERLADVDPVSLVLEHVRPDTRVELARHLLAQPEVFEALVPVLDSWTDPQVRRAEGAELRAARAERRPEVEREIQRRVAVDRVVNGVRDNVDALAELVPQELRQQFMDDALGDASRYIRANRVRDPFAPDQFRTVVNARLRLYGITDAQAQAALTGQPVPPSTAGTPRPKGPDAERIAREAQGRRKNGQQLAQEQQRRRDVAGATPGAGVGPALPRATPPAGQGIKERAAWMRQHLQGRRG